MYKKYELIDLPENTIGLQRVLIPCDLMDEFKNNEVMLGFDLEDSDKISEDQLIDDLGLFVTRESMTLNNNYYELPNGDFKVRTMPVYSEYDPDNPYKSRFEGETEDYTDKEYPPQETTIFSYDSLIEKNVIYTEYANKGIYLTIQWFNLWGEN